MNVNTFGEDTRQGYVLSTEEIMMVNEGNGSIYTQILWKGTKIKNLGLIL
jgi:hypothetical protein